MKNKSIAKIIILVFICIIFPINNINADSGFEAGYGDAIIAGAESLGGYSGLPLIGVFIAFLDNLPYGDLVKDYPIITGILCFVLILCSIVIIYHMFKNLIFFFRKLSHRNKLTKILPIGKSKIEKDVTRIFKQIIKNYSQLNLNTMKRYLTDGLYEKYNFKLEILENNKQRNIIKNLIFTDIKIISTEKNLDNYIIKCDLSAQFRSYIINDKKHIVDGSRFTVTTHNYELEFIMIPNNEKMCPYCGTENQYKLCSKCHSIILNNDFRMIMSKSLIKSENKKNVKKEIICLMILTIMAVISIIRIALFYA